MAVILFHFVQLPVRVEHLGAAVVSVFACLGSVMALQTAVMAVMRMDVVCTDCTVDWEI